MCCLRHLSGAANASDDAVEVAAQVVVQDFIGVVVERARAVGWRWPMDIVARGVRMS